MMGSAIGLTLLSLLIILVAVNGQVAPSNVDCTGVPAGTRMWGCKAYHECLADGSSAYVECGWGMVYNELTKNCEHASTVDTPCGTSYRRECRDYGPPFGKIAVKDYVDPQTGLPCQYFFTCANGHFYGTQKCEGFQVFNEILQYCVKPDAAPSSCNPFGPQVANVEKEVNRHWWKSDTAGGKSKEMLKQPWWKAKKADYSVKRSFVNQKHWLTSGAAAKNRLDNNPKFEKMLVKHKNPAQDVSLPRGKGNVAEKKRKSMKEKVVRTKSKAVPSHRNKSKYFGRRPVYARRKPSYLKPKPFSTRRITTATKSSTVAPKSRQSGTTLEAQSKSTTQTKRTTTSGPTTSSTTTVTTTKAKASSTTRHTTSDKTVPRQADHPWSSKDKAAAKSISPREVSEIKSKS